MGVRAVMCRAVSLRAANILIDLNAAHAGHAPRWGLAGDNGIHRGVFGVHNGASLIGAQDFQQMRISGADAKIQLGLGQPQVKQDAIPVLFTQRIRVCAPNSVRVARRCIRPSSSGQAIRLAPPSSG